MGQYIPSLLPLNFYSFYSFLLIERILVTSFQPIGIYPGKYQWAGQPNLGDCSLERVGEFGGTVCTS